MPDLVDDSRPLCSHLVGLPQRRHLLGDRIPDPDPGGLGQRRVVELAEELVQPDVRSQHGAAGRLGRMRGQDELEREPPCCRRQPASIDAAALELCKCLGQRLTGHALLRLVLPAPPKPVVLLGEVGELEVEREGAEHVGLAFERQRGDGGRKPLARDLAAGTARERSDALDVVEQLCAALLDEDATEHVSEESDVAPERRVSG